LAIIANPPIEQLSCYLYYIISAGSVNRQVSIIISSLDAYVRPISVGVDSGAGHHRHLHSEWAYQEVYEQGQFALYAKVKQWKQRLTMRGGVYDALTRRVGGTLDYDVRWQPNEYESDGFVERVRPLELTSGARIFANRTEVVCACGQAVSLI
jgi:hypothetical protein